jgi:hypothetical protein
MAKMMEDGALGTKYLRKYCSLLVTFVDVIFHVTA